MRHSWRLRVAIPMLAALSLSISSYPRQVEATVQMAGEDILKTVEEPIDIGLVDQSDGRNLLPKPPHEDYVSGIPPSADTTVTIPFATPNQFPENGPPRVLMTINGVYCGDEGVMMDTGSTGITIGKGTWIDDFKGDWAQVVTNEKGWKYLSSSKKLYSGYWVPTELIFNGHSPAGERMNLMKAIAPVLVFDKFSICPGHTNAHGATCENPTSVKSGMLSGLYMGVGFGREQDGMITCTPDKNPLLNVVEVNGMPVERQRYHLGYIIRSSSLICGLTPTNTKDYTWTPLSKQPHATDPRDWAMPPVAISISNGRFRTGFILPDTGVTQMYLSSPDISTPAENYTVAFGVPDETATVGGYVLSVGMNGTATSSINGTAPRVVRATCTAGRVTGPGGGVFERVYVNTGSRLWNGYEAAFDAVGGRWGLKRMNNGGSRL
ncbi:hypothetical protein TWF696_007361 [Orbilia brochopaga]|uniref:Uncharacterized protein n=1 Tax=Orbilia brochopaga TaxID=3140254 RepID=A0AAV9UT69_9PEZI